MTVAIETWQFWALYGLLLAELVVLFHEVGYVSSC